MAYLKYGLKEGEGFIVITGIAGTGKSTLVGKLFSELDLQKTVAAQVNATQIVPEDAVKLICKAFGVSVKADDKKGYLAAFEKFLIEQHKINHHVLLVVDEAQHLPQQTLEELYMLSNYTASGQPLFQSFLIGEPDLLSTLAHPNMSQFQEKVIGSYRLEALEAHETKPYILYRLEKVNWSEEPNWLDTAIEIVHMETSGVPRRVNTLCQHIMIYAATKKVKTIDEELVEAVIEHLSVQTNELRQNQSFPQKVASMTENNSNDSLTETLSVSSIGNDNEEDASANETQFEEDTVDDTNVTYFNQSKDTQMSLEYQDLKERVLFLEKKIAEHDNALREVIDFAVTHLSKNNTNN